MAHKALSPASYPCDLCKLTHGTFHEFELWRDWRNRIGLDWRFYHQDEFAERYRREFPLPVVLEEVDGELRELLSAVQIADCATTGDLIEALQRALAAS